MTGFTPMTLGPDFVDALDGKTKYCDPEAHLLKVRPPENNNGLDASIDLLRSFHDYKTESTFLGTKNVSDTTSFEVWYDEGELQFCYYTPNQTREMHYRQQIDGHFRGCEVETKENLFPNVSVGEKVTGGEVWLKKHYFEPIRNKESPDWDDPYLMLFSEMYTRDDTRGAIQVIFQPAEPEWTRTSGNNIDQYAQSMKEPTTESRLFGLIKNERDATAAEKEYAESITQQEGKPAYYVNIRFIIIAPEEQDVLTHADNISKRLKLGYQSVSGQTLSTDPAESTEEVAELIRKFAKRESVNMNRVRGSFHDWWNAKNIDPTKQMIMTLPELAGLLHFPKAKNVNIPAIDWTEVPIEGSLPHDAKRFNRLTHAQRLLQLQRWEEKQEELLEELDVPESEASLILGNPKDEEKSRQLRETYESQRNQGNQPTD